MQVKYEVGQAVTVSNGVRSARFRVARVRVTYDLERADGSVFTVPEEILSEA